MDIEGPPRSAPVTRWTICSRVEAQHRSAGPERRVLPGLVVPEDVAEQDVLSGGQLQRDPLRRAARDLGRPADTACLDGSSSFHSEKVVMMVAPENEELVSHGAGVSHNEGHTPGRH